LFVSEGKHALNFEGFIKDAALSFQQRDIIAGLIFWQGHIIYSRSVSVFD